MIKAFQWLFWMGNLGFVVTQIVWPWHKHPAAILVNLLALILLTSILGE